MIKNSKLLHSHFQVKKVKLLRTSYRLSNGILESYCELFSFYFEITVVFQVWKSMLLIFMESLIFTFIIS